MPHLGPLLAALLVLGSASAPPPLSADGPPGRPAVRTAPLAAAAEPAPRLPDAPPGTPLKIAENPGRLGAYVYLPRRLAERPALVVALHGCAQRAADFDDETGWVGLADTAGFLLLFPEQSPANNPARCFNWFRPRDARRDGGEAESIRHQVEAVLERQPVDRERIFVTGLSAGGAMAAIMLATHPDLFAGGAILAGVPYGCAAGAFEAMPCMTFGNRLVPGPAAWAERVRAAAPRGSARWPRVAIWHDAGDRVVNPFNAMSSLEQWTAVHGIDRIPELDRRVGPHRQRVYGDATGRPLVELTITQGVGHATPIDPKTGCGRDPGTATDFVVAADLCAARLIARFWGLVE